MVKVGVFGNVHAEGFQEALKKIRHLWGENALLCKEIGGPYDQSYINRNAQFIISLGGDGTLLKAVARFTKPLIGVNLGKLGFLTYFQVEDLPIIKIALEEKKYYLDRREKLRLWYRDKTYYALNDFYVNPVSGTALNITVRRKETLITHFYGDGIIISSPTGSTAYNLSAGGPIVHPRVKAFILTPLCPHNLSARPLVLPKGELIEVEVVPRGTGKWILSGDGMKLMEFDGPDSFKVELSDRRASLVRLDITKDFFDILREKLNWK